MANTTFDADVIVVGCGPVGVMAALRCAQRGLHVIAVDRSNEIYPLPRALGMDDEIQDVFGRAGLLDSLRANSIALPGAQFVNAAGEQVVGIELPEGTLGALGHPLVVTFNQPALEQALRDAAVSEGVDMRLGLDAFAVADIDGGVQIGLTDNTGDVHLSAPWLIAADGAKSTVRSLRGIELEDQGFDQTWLVVDATLLDPDLPLPRLAQQVCDPARVCTLVPGPGLHRRWEFQLRDDEAREQVLADDAVEEFLAPWGTPEQIQVDRAAVYRFHATVAERFRDGPVLLAGDAAHQMPPFNGQGMCTGIRDVENLTWKLAQVSNGQADARLLDTYDEERRPHAASQVAHSVDAGLLMQAIAFDGDAALESGYGQKPFPQLVGSGLDASHPSVGTIIPGGPNPKSVDGWSVITASPSFETPPGWAAIGGSVTLAKAADFTGLLDDGQAVIVRPDRYIAAVTNDVGAAIDRITDWLGQSYTSTGATS
jgi:3-(3-hydroxy-phenyl)propionate hydroxylase